MNEKLGIAGFVIWGVIVIASIGGWVANVVKLFGMLGDHIEVTGMLVMRIIGVFAAPIGAILGYL